MSHGWQGEAGEVGPLERLGRSELLVLGGRYADWCLDEDVRALNWELFGPKRNRRGEWTKGAHRVGTCGSVLASRVAGGRSNGTVDANGQPGRGRRRSGQLRGLESCGSANVCPRCARKIRGQRAAEIETVLRGHLAQGGGAAMFTFTFSHERVEAVRLVVDDAMDAWDGLYHSEAWKRVRQASAGRYIRNTEATYSDWHGAHPHHHVVVLFDQEPTPAELEATRRDLTAAWTTQAAKVGRQVDPMAGVNAEVIRDDAGIGQYVSKISMEMSRSDRKIGHRRQNRSRSPWEIAADACDPRNPKRTADRMLWQEFVTTMASHRFVAFSRGIRESFGLRVESDETVAAKELPMTVTVYLEPQVIRLAQRHRVVADLRLSLERGDAPAKILAMLSDRLPVSLELVEPGDEDRGIPEIRPARLSDDDPQTHDQLASVTGAGGNMEPDSEDRMTGSDGDQTPPALFAEPGPAGASVEVRRWWELLVAHVRSSRRAASDIPGLRLERSRRYAVWLAAQRARLCIDAVDRSAPEREWVDIPHGLRIDTDIARLRL